MGCRLGRFVLRRSLGQGGNGQVFLAWKDNATGDPLPCVVKLPLLRYVKSTRECKRLVHEGRLGVRLGPHPNVVHVTDVDVYYGMPIIAMQYVDGIDLRLLLRFARGHEGLSLAVIYCVLAGIGTALNHAHREATINDVPVSIIHRDVKPANILLTRDGMVKLADFGIGVAMEDGTSGSHLRGSTRYMSPEHLSSKVCPKMDIYSLGAVAWEMIENRPFREDVPEAEIYAAIMDAKIPPFDNQGVPRELVDLTRQCLDPNPSRRPTADEFLKALRNCPGFRSDLTVLKHELGPLIGTQRSSGASQEEPAATPELMATLAALRMELQIDSHCTTAVQPVARGAAPRRSAKAYPEHEDADAAIEPDAPRMYRRQRNRPTTGSNETAGLEGSFVHEAAAEPSSDPIEARRKASRKGRVGASASDEPDPASSTETTRKKPRKDAPSGLRLDPALLREAIRQVRETMRGHVLVMLLAFGLFVSAVSTVGTVLLLGALADGPTAEPSTDREAVSTTGRAE